jgi:hypothetical protein
MNEDTNDSNDSTLDNLAISPEKLRVIANRLESKIDNISCDRDNIQEMRINLQAGRDIWYDLYDDEQDWLTWGLPWVQEYLKEKA